MPPPKLAAAAAAAAAEPDAVAHLTVTSSGRGVAPKQGAAGGGAKVTPSPSSSAPAPGLKRSRSSAAAGGAAGEEGKRQRTGSPDLASPGAEIQVLGGSYFDPVANAAGQGVAVLLADTCSFARIGQPWARSSRGAPRVAGQRLHTARA